MYAVLVICTPSMPRDFRCSSGSTMHNAASHERASGNQGKGQREYEASADCSLHYLAASLYTGPRCETMGTGPCDVRATTTFDHGDCCRAAVGPRMQGVSSIQ